MSKKEIQEFDLPKGFISLEVGRLCPGDIYLTDNGWRPVTTRLGSNAQDHEGATFAAPDQNFGSRDPQPSPTESVQAVSLSEDARRTIYMEGWKDHGDLHGAGCEYGWNHSNAKNEAKWNPQPDVPPGALAEFRARPVSSEPRKTKLSFEEAWSKPGRSLLNSNYQSAQWGWNAALANSEVVQEVPVPENENSALASQVGGGHYKTLPIQPVEYIHKNGLGYIEGAVIKYVTRWKNKNGVEDLCKARHFLDLLIEMETSDLTPITESITEEGV